MDIWTATEQAYKNGYAKGCNEAIKAFSEELKEEMWKLCFYEKDDIAFPFSFIDKVAKSILEDIESENNYGI